MPVLRARGEQFVAGHCERVAKAGLEVQGQSRESNSCSGGAPTLRRITPQPPSPGPRREKYSPRSDETWATGTYRSAVTDLPPRRGQGQGKRSTQPQRDSNLESLLAVCISFSLRRSRCGRSAQASLHPKTRLR